MAKAILEFNLGDHDDRMEHLRCVKSTDMALVLWEIVYNMKKGTIRHFEAKEELADNEGPDYKGTPYYEVIDYVWDQILSQLEDHDVFVDKLID